MTPERHQVIEKIRKAFAGVSLGNGIGLKEAQGLDDYEDEWTCAKYRESDEKKDWTKFSPSELAKCHSSLSFFDPEGMRFHLPAFLIAELEETMWMSTELHLTRLDDYRLSQLSLLSTEQKRAVESFLWEILNDRRFRHSHEDISTALEDYWMK